MSQKKEDDILDEEIGDIWKVLKHTTIDPAVKHELSTHTTAIPFKDTEIVIHEDPLQERGYRLWKACHYLCKYLERPEIVEQVSGKRAIEIGSGTGLAGLALAHLGAHVTLTDTPSVLDIIHINIKANEGKGMATRADVAPCVWGEDCGALKPPYEILLASDVLYHEDSHGPLLATLRDLSDTNTRIIFAYERRRKINDRFFKKATKYFDWKLIPATDINPGTEDAVTIYLMQKRDTPLAKNKKTKAYIASHMIPIFRPI